MDVRATKQVDNGRAQLRRTAAAVFGVLFFAAMPAPSLARSAPKAKFKATVEGVQTITWKRDYFTPSQESAMLASTSRRASPSWRPVMPAIRSANSSARCARFSAR